MKTMKTVNDLLNESETAQSIGLAGDEGVMKAYDLKPKTDLTIWKWESDGGSYGFLRDDASGLRAIGMELQEDFEKLGAWNCDFDIRLLGEYMSVADLALALYEAKLHSWGFDGHKNDWDK
jgi:hypothetical protein